MLAKATSKYQMILPNLILSDFPDTEDFDVSKENGRIVLTYVNLMTANAVRAKLTELGITESDIAPAVTWSRQNK